VSLPPRRQDEPAGPTSSRSEHAATDPVLLAERQGVVFVATAGNAGGLVVPRRYWRPEIGVVAIPSSDDERCAAEVTSLEDTGAWRRAVPRPDLLAPALSRLTSGDHVEMSLAPGVDGLKAMLVAADGHRHPFPIAPKDSVGLLAAVLHHAPRGVVTAAGSGRPQRLLLSVRPGGRPHEYRLRVAGVAGAAPPASLADLGLSPALVALLNETLDRPCGLLLVSGGSGSGRTTTLALLADALAERGRSGGRIGPRAAGAGPPWLANALTDWPFPESLRESAPDFVLIERLEGLRHLALAARLAGTGALVLAGAPSADPPALAARVRRDIEASAGADVPATILSQALVRTVCPECRAFTLLPQARALRLGFHRRDLEEMERHGGIGVPAGRGCASCCGTGVAGITGVFGCAVPDDSAHALPSLREEGWRKVTEGHAVHEDVLALPGAHRSMRSLREIAVLAGVPFTPPQGAGEEGRIATPPPGGIAVAEPGAPLPSLSGQSATDAEELARHLRAAGRGQPPVPGRLAEMARALAGRATEGDLVASLNDIRDGFPQAPHAVNCALIAARVLAGLGQAEDAPAAALLALVHIAPLAEVGVDPGALHPEAADYETLDPGGRRLRPAPIIASLGIEDPEMAARVVDVHVLLAAGATGERSRADVRSQAVALGAIVDRVWSAGRARGTDLNDVASAVVSAHGQRFSPLLFRGLLRAIPIFPVGCYVELSSGDVARVVSQNDENHFRPRVEVTQAAGRPGSARRLVDLARAPFLHIRHRVAAPPAAAGGGR
jgi:hypothetical protein